MSEKSNAWVRWGVGLGVTIITVTLAVGAAWRDLQRTQDTVQRQWERIGRVEKTCTDVTVVVERNEARNRECMETLKAAITEIRGDIKTILRRTE